MPGWGISGFQGYTCLRIETATVMKVWTLQLKRDHPHSSRAKACLSEEEMEAELLRVLNTTYSASSLQLIFRAGRTSSSGCTGPTCYNFLR